MQVGPLRILMKRRTRKVPEKAQKKIRAGSFSRKSTPIMEQAIINPRTILQVAPRLVLRVMIAWISEK
jgi:hypothetical protein